MLPTVLALYYMYATLTFQGRDRAGNLFRYMTIDMLRLNLARRVCQHHDKNTDTAQEKLVKSKALWGLFIYEGKRRLSYRRCMLTPIQSRICSMYRHKSFIDPPTIPRLFEVVDQDNRIWISGPPFYERPEISTPDSWNNPFDLRPIGAVLRS